MPDEADPAAIRADLGQAIADVLAKHEGGFVTKWVALIETVGPDGDRGLWVTAANDAMPWDTIGMLQYALNVETAQPDEDD